MKLVILGSGTAVPHPSRSSAGFWLGTDKGSVLLDLSPSAIHRMAQEGLEWAGLDAIWISHYHLDHCGGLAPFLFGTRNAPQVHGREKPLKIVGPGGLREVLERFDTVCDYKLFRQPFPLEILEVEPLESFQIIPGLDAVTFDTPHTKESRAIRLTATDGASLVYSGDTGFSKPLGAFSKSADVLILECSFVEDKPVKKHLELSEAVYLARYSKAKKTVLTHLYPEWDEVDFRSQVDAFDPGCEIIEAKDGLTLSIDQGTLSKA